MTVLDVTVMAQAKGSARAAVSMVAPPSYPRG
jgi:hypothetical protein